MNSPWKNHVSSLRLCERGSFCDGGRANRSRSKMSPHIGDPTPSYLGFAPSKSLGLPWGQALPFLIELGLGDDQSSSDKTEQGSIDVQVTRPGHNAYKSLSLPRTHGDLYETTVAPHSHPPVALLLRGALRHAACPSLASEGPS